VTLNEVADGVFCVPGTAVNWVLVREGRDLTLVDGGYPGDLAAVEASIRALGLRPQDVRGILLTHAHVDHLGALTPFHERYGTPAYADPAEVPHAHRDHLEQAGPLDVVRRLHHPGMLRWSLQIARAGALRHGAAAHVLPFPSPDPDPGPNPSPSRGPGPLDLPGAPLPVPCPGHTSGHSAYLFAKAGVLVTGDALATGHPLAPTRGPQLLPGFFGHDRAAERRALERLAQVDAGVVVPGHGAPWTGTPKAAVDLAMARKDP
jgi:glyoxylase-like metal-dependent hydrolase (beta-lactamase superfamily II)